MPPRNLQGKQQRRQSAYKLPVEEGIFLTKEKACDRITITGLCVSVTKKIPCFESGKSTMQRNFIVFFC
jgi:hypothetical protein